MSLTISDMDSRRTARLKLIYLGPLALLLFIPIAIYSTAPDYFGEMVSAWKHKSIEERRR